MIKLTRDTDSIFPHGLRGTPFEVVYKAIQSVAGDVWDVDPTAYRAAIAWGYYLTQAPEVLVDCQAGREFVANVLVSEQAPLVKDTQTTEELVELLRLWRDYSPTFERLEALYEPYAARVDIRPITDADSWQALPLDDTAGAFYVAIAEIDWARPLTLGEARTIALRATPMGSQPHAIFFFEEASRAYARPSFGDVSAYVIETELPAPAPPVPPQPTQSFDYAGNFTLGESVQSDSVAGGQGYLQRSLVFKNFIQLIGWNEGGNTVKNNHPKSLNALIGWEEGGNFRDDLTSITVLLGLRYDGNDWTSKTFDSNDYWWSGILSEDNKNLIESIGLVTMVMPYLYGGPIGSIVYDAEYRYQILGLYSDISGTQEVQTDLSNLYVAPQIPTGDSTQYVCICNHIAITTPSITWKVRITKN